MKYTQYFQHRRTFPDRIGITDQTIKLVLENPIRREIQSDGRIKLWGNVSGNENKILRVILLQDGETVHNAFFDRTFKKDK